MRTRATSAINIIKIISISIFFSLFCSDSHVLAKEPENQCVACHKNPGFFTTNKKIYKYFKEWEGSIHKQEGVNCSDCHGGDSASSDKDKAHSNNVREMINPIKYENILETCGKCHKENLNHFLKSNHYNLIISQSGKYRAPNCITCHSSINTPVPTAATVFDICNKCHNVDTENFPDIPAKAKKLMEKLSYLEHYYRSMVSKGVKEGRHHLPVIVDAQFFLISEAWHEFDIEKIEKATGGLRNLLQEKRKEMVKNKEN